MNKLQAFDQKNENNNLDDIANDERRDIPC